MSTGPGRDIAQADLLTLTEFQRDMHFSSRGERNPENHEDSEDNITSNFLREQRKTTWYSRIQMRLAMTGTGEDYEFTVNNTLHHLEMVDIIAELPPLRVKKEYKNIIRICWCHNLLHNIINEAAMYKDVDIVTYINSYWLDEYSQYYLKPGMRDSYLAGIGNVPFLEEWSDSLPGYTLTAPQPWSISEDISLAFPLFYLPEKSRLIFRYKFRLLYRDLIRMQRYEKERGWVDIKYQCKFLEGVGLTAALKPPILRGHYDYMSPEELEWWTCISRVHSMYINHVISIHTHNAQGYGDNVQIELTAPGPCRALHWVAEEQGRLSFNNRSNYTTSDEVYKGWAPWSNYQIIYGGGSQRTEDTQVEVAERLDPYHFARTAPYEPGYGYYSYANNPMALDVDIGISLSKARATLNIRLTNTDPFLRPSLHGEGIVPEEYDGSGDELDSTDNASQMGSVVAHRKRSPAFLLHVNMLVTRKLVFKYHEGNKRFDLQILDARV